MTERPASDGREGYGAHPDEVDMCNDAEIADFGLIGHKTENLLRKIHPGPIADGARRMARYKIK